MVHQIEAEERATADRLLATTEELEKARSKLQSMEQAIEEAITEMAKLVIEGPKQSEPVALVTVQNNKTLVTEVVPDTNKMPSQHLATLREDQAAEEALRARERELKKAAEEEQRNTADSLRRAEENVRKGHQAYDHIRDLY